MDFVELSRVPNSGKVAPRDPDAMREERHSPRAVIAIVAYCERFGLAISAQATDAIPMITDAGNNQPIIRCFMC